MISLYFKYEVWQLRNILCRIGICKEWKSLKGIGDSDHFPVYWQFKNKITICFIKDEMEQGVTLEAVWFFMGMFGDLFPFSIPLHPINTQIFWNKLLCYNILYLQWFFQGKSAYYLFILFFSFFILEKSSLHLEKATALIMWGVGFLWTSELFQVQLFFSWFPDPNTRLSIWWQGAHIQKWEKPISGRWPCSQGPTS